LLFIAFLSNNILKNGQKNENVAKVLIFFPKFPKSTNCITPPQGGKFEEYIPLERRGHNNTVAQVQSR
jgi:hypothetical protein